MFDFFHVPSLTADELRTWQQEGRTFELVDVREPEEHTLFNIGGKLVPLMELPGRFHELPTDRPLVIYCRSGSRSAMAVQMLRQAGLDAYNLNGGLLEWKTTGATEERAA